MTLEQLKSLLTEYISYDRDSLNIVTSILDEIESAINEQDANFEHLLELKNEKESLEQELDILNIKKDEWEVQLSEGVDREYCELFINNITDEIESITDEIEALEFQIDTLESEITQIE